MQSNWRRRVGRKVEAAEDQLTCSSLLRFLEHSHHEGMKALYMSDKQAEAFDARALS